MPVRSCVTASYASTLHANSLYASASHDANAFHVHALHAHVLHGSVWHAYDSLALVPHALTLFMKRAEPRKRGPKVVDSK